MQRDSGRGSSVNACKTLVSPKNARSATPRIAASRFELPLLGSNQDSPDPESGVLPVTPRGRSHAPSRTYAGSGFRQKGQCARMVCKNDPHAVCSRSSRPPSTTAKIVASSGCW
jgi:hypothetical protein